jgi:hypothetical protein
MVNFLEALYVLTVVALIAATVLYLKGRRVAAGRAGMLGVLGALISVALYWYLSSRA